MAASCFSAQRSSVGDGGAEEVGVGSSCASVQVRDRRRARRGGGGREVDTGR
jgi:hypothetical protein